MSRRYLFSTETLKTIGQGALGAVTFGIYHRSTTNKMMEVNNENNELRHKFIIEQMKTQHDKELGLLKKKIVSLENICKTKKNT
jgi:hypothetical protein